MTISPTLSLRFSCCERYIHVGTRSHYNYYAEGFCTSVLIESWLSCCDAHKQTKHATFRIELKGLGGFEVVFCKQRGAGVRGWRGGRGEGGGGRGEGAKDQQWGG